jgi:hypothetical protein
MYAGLAWWTEFFSLYFWTRVQKIEGDPEKPKERSLTVDSSKDSRQGSGHGDLPCSEDLQRAPGHKQSMLGPRETPIRQGEHLSSGRDDTGNLEVLTEKVGTLDLRQVKRNRSGSAKKRARGALQAGASRRPDTDYASARDLLVVCMKAGRLRGPGTVGNRAMPELLRMS